MDAFFVKIYPIDIKKLITINIEPNDNLLTVLNKLNKLERIDECIFLFSINQQNININNNNGYIIVNLNQMIYPLINENQMFAYLYKRNQGVCNFYKQNCKGKIILK